MRLLEDGRENYPAWLTAISSSETMAEVVDECGVDRSVEAAASALSPEQRRQTEENPRRFIERVRTAIQQNG